MSWGWEVVAQRIAQESERQLAVLPGEFTHLSFFSRNFKRLTTSGKLTQRGSALKEELKWFHHKAQQLTSHLAEKFPSQRELSEALIFPHPRYLFNKSRVTNSWLLSTGLNALVSLWTSSPDTTLVIQIRVRSLSVYSNCQCFYCNFWEFCRKFLTKMKVFGKCLRK